MKVNSSVIVGGFGDYADFQYIMKLMEQQTIDDRVSTSQHCQRGAVQYSGRFDTFIPLT